MGHKWFCLVRVGVGNGFVWFIWQFGPQGFEPFELLDCAAVVAFRLGLIADGQGPTVGLADHTMESFAQQVVAVLGARDFDIPVAGEFLVHEDSWVAVGVECLVETGGEEAGFEARGAEDSLLGEGDRSMAKSSWELRGW